MVLSQVVVVELHESLDGLLHRAHLDQSHLVVLPGGGGEGGGTGSGSSDSTEATTESSASVPGQQHQNHWNSLEELEGLDFSSGAGEQHLQVVLHHTGTTDRHGAQH